MRLAFRTRVATGPRDRSARCPCCSPRWADRARRPWRSRPAVTGRARRSPSLFVLVCGWVRVARRHRRVVPAADGAEPVPKAEPAAPILAADRGDQGLRRPRRAPPAHARASRAGQSVALVGHNGSGKSTFLAMAAGLLELSDGEITVLGEPAGSSPARAAVSYLPDAPVLYDDLSVREHLAYVAALHGVPIDEADLDELLDRLGLRDRADDLPARFSRGLRQRTSIALGLVRPFELLLVDEPFVGLDASGKECAAHHPRRAPRRRRRPHRGHPRPDLRRPRRPLHRPARRPGHPRRPRHPRRGHRARRLIRNYVVDTYISECYNYRCGPGPQGDRRTPSAGDPPAGAGRRALLRRDRRAVRRHRPGHLPAPRGAQGGRVS